MQKARDPMPKSLARMPDGLIHSITDPGFHVNIRIDDMRFHNPKYMEKAASVGGLTADFNLHGVTLKNTKPKSTHCMIWLIFWNTPDWQGLLLLRTAMQIHP